MAKDPALVVGPMDPDRVARLVGNMGVHNNARRLLQRAAAQNPPELQAALNKPTDSIRSEAVEANPDELAAAAKKAGLPDHKIVGASVRGGSDIPDNDRVLVLTLENESGRTYRVVLNYGESPLDESKATATRIRRLRLGVDATAVRLAMGNEAQAGADRPASADEAEELRRTILDLEDELDKAKSGDSDEPAGPAEPFEDASKAKVEDVEAAIEAVDDPLEREILKRDIRAFEEATHDEPRKGVVTATEPVALVPAPEEE